MKLTGSVRLELKDEAGKVIEERFAPNVVVIVGKNYLAQWLTANSQSGKFMSYVGLGTSTTPALNTDTILGSELPVGPNYSRQSGTLTATTNIWTNVTFFPVLNGTGVINEIGLFSTVSGGTMFAHQVFSAGITKAPNNTLTVTWQISFT
jgi:hypothetical protein